jgi:hypothetical protein
MVSGLSTYIKSAGKRMSHLHEDVHRHAYEPGESSATLIEPSQPTKTPVEDSKHLIQPDEA